MNKLARLYWTAKGVGWRNIPRRVLQAYRIRSGWLKKSLACEHFNDRAFARACSASIDDMPALWRRRSERFFAVPSRDQLVLIADDTLWNQQVVSVCEKALLGEYLMFGKWFGRLGWPPDFNRDPMNNLQWQSGQHWMDGPDSLGGEADIKLVWEASRFSLAYYFARAYARDGNEKWACAFWEMFDAWIEQNPPQLTVNWRCGQEMTFRLMAMVFAAIVTLPSKSATPQRLWTLTQLAWQTGLQLRANINYARSQGNNHAISEATGLWTIGLLFEELAQSSSLKEQGRRVLRAELRRQVHADGSYVQNSMNYHRVMLDDMLWAIRLGQLADDPLCAEVIDRFKRAANWLWEMLDLTSGRVPNYGANDGAQVLPLSCGEYLDYRPVVQAANFAATGSRYLDNGFWNEKLLWLYGAQALAREPAPPKRSSLFAADSGGYYILRGTDSWAMTRCTTHRTRPSQCDMLHVDLWYKGINILRDAGSYMYNCPEPWKSYFSSTRAHNTVTIDDAEQMVKGPRFLWFRWPRVRVSNRSISIWKSGLELLQMEHSGYSRLGVVHRRSILQIRNLYVIVDDLLGAGEHEATLRWSLPQADWEQTDPSTWIADVAKHRVTISVSSSVKADRQINVGLVSNQPAGWESLYYGMRQPAPVLQVRAATSLPIRFVTIAGTCDVLT